MFELNGKHTDAILYLETYEDGLFEQIYPIINSYVSKDLKVRIMPDAHVGKGICIGFTMELGRYLNPNWCGVDIGCTDMDTEYLTKNGWKKISEYSNEELAIYDLSTNSSKFELPINYIKTENDEFYHLRTKYGIDQMITKEHKCLIERGTANRPSSRGQKYVISAEELYKKHSATKNGFRDNFISDIPNLELLASSQLSDEQIRVQIMVMADGHITKNGMCDCQFKKQRKITRCVELLNSSNISYEIRDRIADGVVSILFTPPTTNKRLSTLKDCDKKQLTIICDEIMNWDGTIKDNVFTSVFKEDVDFAQYCFAVNGFRTNILYDDREGKESWRLLVSNSAPRVQLAGTPKSPIEIVKSVDGFKYCFTTSTGYWIMRRNGCICVTGNCGMLSGRFKANGVLDLAMIDEKIKKLVPMGFNVHEGAQSKKIPYDEVQKLANEFAEKYNEKFGTSYVAPTYSEKWLKNKLKTIGMDAEKLFKSIGTLGSGNHFIELGYDEESKDNWITVHCGSRNLGVKVCEYWLRQAKTQSNTTSAEYVVAFDDIISKTVDRNSIPKLIAELREQCNKGIDRDYLSDELSVGYLFDMIFAQKYAEWNRQAILDIIQKILKVKAFEEVISSVHNYVDFHDFIIRKGSISSYVGQKMIIPFNQKDGMLICEGKSNPDWNNSAPHGAGRLYSRSKAKELISLEMVEESMKGIYSTSVCTSTIDESVFAYKDSKMIEAAIQDTATILHRVKPVLNIKDSTSAPRRTKKNQ